MVAENWIEHRRCDDDELLGFLMPTQEGGHVPVTVFGHPLAEPGDRQHAETVLDSVGLSYLADRWTLHSADGPISA